MSAFSAKLEFLRARRIPWCLEPSLQLVENFESYFGSRLPADYRGFLASHGGVFVDATYPFVYPTPFGEGLIGRFYGFARPVPPEHSKGGDVREATRLVGEAPHVVAIGDDTDSGGTILMECAGEAAGSVYFHDPDFRWRWHDADHYKDDPQIQRLLELRRANLLRSKPGREDWYLVARSFPEFMALLTPLTS